MRIFFLFTSLIFANTVNAQVKVLELTCEHKINPITIATLTPRLSWKLESSQRNITQKAYQIQVSHSADFKKTIWDSGKTISGESILQKYLGKGLTSGSKYYWHVKVWDNNDNVSGWSKVSSWEMGLLSTSEWKAKWIEPLTQSLPKVGESAAYLLRKTFTLKGKIQSAKAYVTSHGFYELNLNGKKVGKELLTPGWTVYQKRLQYQTYDVKNLLSQGQNAVGAMLGEGWYRGFISWKRTNKPFYGNRLGLLCQINIKYEGGREEWIVTDGSWVSTSEGPIRMNDIYDGETYDATREINNWSEAVYDDKKWVKVAMADFDNSNLITSEGLKVEQIQEIKPVKVFRTPKGELVADMGQNMVGWARLKLNGKKGTKIILEHGEVLDNDGNFYKANMRNAKTTTTYILKGGGEEIYEPRFTFFGFRYILIRGLELTADNITGIVVHSNMQPTGQFECSDPLVNQLQHNIQWGQKGNFVDIPTDCPQRDERFGWTGDAQAFIRTAAFNFDVSAFFTKWLKDVAADQKQDGSVPNIIPDVISPKNLNTIPHIAGWGDVAVIAPWTMYLTYGDKDLLANQYPSMKASIDYLQKKIGPTFISQKADGFGDWLSYKPNEKDTNNILKDGYTDKKYINTAFYGYVASIMQKTATALNEQEEAQEYGRLFQKIKTAFIKEYIDENGKIKPIEGKETDSQTAYVLALMFDLMPQELQAKAAKYLVEDVKSRGNHLSTGFLGTPYLCHVLSSNGYTDVAYDLLLQKTYPSWLYPVTMGATSIWERWDGQKPDGTFQTESMNSFNHYAYGAVGDWIYRVSSGIEVDPTKPGYKHFYIQPQPTVKWSYAKTSLNSPYGKINSRWELENGKIKISITIPTNTSATVTLPNSSQKNVEIDHTDLNKSGLKISKNYKNDDVITLGSGEYVFNYNY